MKTLENVTFHHHYRYGIVVPMERASVATDGDSRTAMDGAKCPLEWVPQALTVQLLANNSGAE